MGFEIDQQAYSEASINVKRPYISTPGEYIAVIEAAKVVKIKQLNGYKTGVVEFRVVEGPEDGERAGTGCNWMACSNPMYSTLQLSELKNFTQQALRAAAAADGGEPSVEELDDASLINTIFVDADDHEEGNAPQSPATGLQMRIRYSEKTNKEGNSFIIGAWV